MVMMVVGSALGPEDRTNGDSSEGGISETEDNSEENGHTLGVVDGSVNKENLAEVVPDNAALTHSSDNGGKVIVSEDHLGGLTGDIGTLLAHGNTHIGGLEGGGIVDTIAGHGGDLSLGLE